MKRFCLIGENIGYSLSPIIHSALYEVLGVNAEYSLVDIPQTDFEKKIECLREFDGFNITKPYKERFLQYVKNTGLSSVNTVTVKNGEFLGASTDGEGFIFSVKNIPLRNKDVLLIGAGGAAKSIAHSLHKVGARIYIYNRTWQRAEELANQVGGRVLDHGESFSPEIIINASTLGQNGEMSLPKSVGFKRAEFIFDAVYQKTLLIELAKREGIRYEDGYKMLVYQAILAEKIWLGFELSEQLCSDIFKRIEKKR